jgi:hypothetical protein
MQNFILSCFNIRIKQKVGFNNFIWFFYSIIFLSQLSLSSPSLQQAKANNAAVHETGSNLILKQKCIIQHHE